MKYKIGFVTCEEIPKLTESEIAFTEFAKDLGILIEPVIWSKPDSDYSGFDMLVIRSCWDYHLRINEFRRWLINLTTQSVHVLNRVKTMQANMHKFYLEKLLKNGVPVIDTLFVEKGTVYDITESLSVNHWEKAVIKPAISASAFKTYIADEGNLVDIQKILDDMLSESDILIQKYADEINTDGEWSLMYFNKRFSHSVLKKPKDNDFRVQLEHGGSYEIKTAPSSVVKQADRIFENYDDELLYTRVDGVVIDGTFRLMELELIEPELFLLNEASMRNFAEAILFYLKKKKN